MITDTEAIERIAAFMNQPGPVNGGDLVNAVTEAIEATGREVVDFEMGEPYNPWPDDEDPPEAYIGGTDS